MLTRRQLILGGLGAAALSAVPGAMASPVPGGSQAFARIALASLAFDLREPGRLSRAATHITGVIAAAGSADAKILVLPELILGGLDYSRPDGTDDDWWALPATEKAYPMALESIRKAALLAGVDVFFGGVEFLAGRRYNCVFLATHDGKLTSVQRKYATNPLMLGTKHFTSGQLPTEASIVTVRGLRVLPIVCANILMDEYRHVAAKACPDVIVVSGNWWVDEHFTVKKFASYVERLSVNHQLVMFSNYVETPRRTPYFVAYNGKMLHMVPNTPAEHLTTFEFKPANAQLTLTSELALTE